MADQNRVLLILMGQLLAEVRALRQLQEASTERERSMGRPLTPMSCLVEAAQPVLPRGIGKRGYDPERTFAQLKADLELLRPDSEKARFEQSRAYRLARLADRLITSLLTAHRGACKRFRPLFPGRGDSK